jgi:hypothetical protein
MAAGSGQNEYFLDCPEAVLGMGGDHAGYRAVRGFR